MLGLQVGLQATTILVQNHAFDASYFSTLKRRDLTICYNVLFQFVRTLAMGKVVQISWRANNTFFARWHVDKHHPSMLVAHGTHVTLTLS